ncbi:hypothetical protein OGAPHI_006237 [Ogataea philodendri]|uniref:Uncharacterized protein n=1 Tax=Ogataea philodendri TaxID=1378263 RepID=A0A9P8T112_9ASCO|nr:uncharacterized protein OGAPHI_006237 [Ogataea philodendri]KAH3662056.1 hypothetical protein OGAPHI_006237 [Ogataea philodendri]
MRRLNTAKSGIHKPERPAVLNFQSAVKENSVLTSMPLSRPQDENVFLSPKHDRKISSDSELKQLLLENSKLMQKLAKNQEKIMELVKNR